MREYAFDQNSFNQGHSRIDPPESIEEWWANVDKVWDDLMGILERFLPLWEPATQRLFDYPSIWGGPRVAKAEMGNPTVADSLRVDIKRCRETRDKRLLTYFEAAWHAAPDTPEIRSIPKWGVLCDLCSEAWVFDE